MPSTKIPFFSLDRHIKKLENEFKQSFKELLESKNFIGEASVSNIENKLSRYLKTNHSITCNSGTDALWLALKALNIQENDIVITTPFSFIASSSEIVMHKAHPVFIDIDKKTFNIDTHKTQNWLQKNCIIKNGITLHKQTNYKVTGILPVDIFGQCADYEKIQKIAQEWNLWTIQDSCQAIGANLNNKQAGTHCNIGCFSFYPTKNLGAFGDGGCCVTNNPEVAEKLYKLRNHGRASHYHYDMLGKNSRLDGIQAKVLSIQLDHLDEYIDSRRQIAQTYNEKFKNLTNIITPKQILGKHVYHQYTIQAIDKNGNIFRDELQEQLKQYGITTRVFYPKILPEIKFLNTDERLKTDCPIAKKLTMSILALPVWPELEKSEVIYICDKIIEICESKHVNKKKNKEIQISL